MLLMTVWVLWGMWNTAGQRPYFGDSGPGTTSVQPACVRPLYGGRWRASGQTQAVVQAIGCKLYCTCVCVCETTVGIVRRVTSYYLFCNAVIIMKSVVMI